MFRKFVKPFGSALLCLAACCGIGHATTRVVGKSAASCPNAQYNTIAAAVSAAAPGDEIDVCPALYPEQLLITKPLTLRGITVNGIDRVLLQPAPLADLAGLPFEAVITVMNTQNVTIDNLAVDASKNTVSGCDLPLAGVHFLNSTGAVRNNAISGAKAANTQACANFFPGNGFGVQVDVDNSCGSCKASVEVEGNSIHDFSRDGILANGAGLSVEIEGNAISGLGPAAGSFQFGVFLANGARGQVAGNVISQGSCGALSPPDCINLRSEGIVLRSAGDGTVIEGNTITTAQSGIYLNGANAARITNNLIKNIDLMDGVDVVALTNSRIEGNRVFGAVPIENQSCGIFELPNASGGADSGNALRNNTINDAFCGVAYVTADHVASGRYFNTLYDTLNTDQVPNPPPPTEPQ